MTLQWDQVTEATSYEAERDGTVFGNIQTNTATFDGFSFLSEHTFRVRAVEKTGSLNGVNRLKEKHKMIPIKKQLIKSKQQVIYQNNQAQN